MGRGGQKCVLTSCIEEFIIGALYRVSENILHVPLSATKSARASWKYKETHINTRECSPLLQRKTPTQHINEAPLYVPQEDGHHAHFNLNCQPARALRRAKKILPLNQSD